MGTPMPRFSFRCGDYESARFPTLESARKRALALEACSNSHEIVEAVWADGKWTETVVETIPHEPA